MNNNNNNNKKNNNGKQNDFFTESTIIETNTNRRNYSLIPSTKNSADNKSAKPSLPNTKKGD